MKETEYSKLRTDEEDEDALPRSPQVSRGSLFWRYLLCALAFCAGILVTLGGIALHRRLNQRGVRLLQSPRDVKVQFAYDNTYPGPPTNESEYAWLDLLPDGLGAVQHDDLSDEIVTISVFHQLHCLMALRHAIYKDWDESRHTQVTPHHYQHCLEYLRQSIMCNGDTNIEKRVVLESGEKFTPGWDVKRCRDYDQIRSWTQEWRAFDGKIPSQKTEIHDPNRVISY